VPHIKKDLHIDIGHNTLPYGPKNDVYHEPEAFIGNGVCRFFMDGINVMMFLN